MWWFSEHILATNQYSRLINWQGFSLGITLEYSTLCLSLVQSCNKKETNSKSLDVCVLVVNFPFISWWWAILLSHQCAPSHLCQSQTTWTAFCWADILCISCSNMVKFDDVLRFDDGCFCCDRSLRTLSCVPNMVPNKPCGVLEVHLTLQNRSLYTLFPPPCTNWKEYISPANTGTRKATNHFLFKCYQVQTRRKHDLCEKKTRKFYSWHWYHKIVACCNQIAFSIWIYMYKSKPFIQERTVSYNELNGTTRQLLWGMTLWFIPDGVPFRFLGSVKKNEELHFETVADLLQDSTSRKVAALKDLSQTLVMQDIIHKVTQTIKCEWICFHYRYMYTSCDCRNALRQKEMFSHVV